ncbi:hypothetical protein [Enterocloster citroniae]|nr:hypothetical protein [Enterocloster citroniae]
MDYFSTYFYKEKWYIHNYEDTAEKNKRREEIIPSADGNHDWIIKVGFE